MNLLLPHIDAVIFDFDDTLVPSTQLYQAAYNALGVAQDDDFLAAKQQVKQRLGPDNPASHQRLLYFKAWLEQGAGWRGTRVSPRDVLALQARYERLVASRMAIDWRRRRRARWLGSLAKHVALGVLTNETTRMQLLKWQAIDRPRGWCRAFVTSEEMGVEKPSRRMFAEIIARLGVSPHRCLMVGDDLLRDVAPARALGMQAVWTTEFLSREAIGRQVRTHLALAQSTPHVRQLECVQVR